jgi:hypothetical protein
MNKNKMIILLAAFLFCSNYAMSQSWTANGILANNDTVLNGGARIAIDGNGNIYFAGEYYITNTSTKGFALWKYNRLGVFERAIHVESSGSTNLSSNADIQVISGSLYVLYRAVKKIAPFDGDLVLMKFNLSLVKQWQVVFAGGGAGFNEIPLGITNGNTSTVQIGAVTSSGTEIIRYNKSNGAFNSSVLYKNGNGNIDIGTKIFFDGSDSYLIGRNQNASASNADMFIVKYDSVLALRWNRVFEASATNTFDELTDISSDASGNVLVGGNYRTTTGIVRTFYTKYNDSNGNRFWIRRLTNNDQNLIGLFSISSGNIVGLTGNKAAGYRFQQIDGAAGTATVNKPILNSAGLSVDQVRLTKGTTDDFYFLGAFDSTYNSGGPQQDKGIIIGRINTSGNRVWDRKIGNDFLGYSISPSAIRARANSQLIYLANVNDPTIPGKTSFAQFASVNGNTGLREGNPLSEQATTLNTRLLVFPNPSSVYTQIGNPELAGKKGEASITSINGSMIAKLNIQFNVNGMSEPIDLQHYAKGIYFIKVDCENLIWNGKILVE